MQNREYKEALQDALGIVRAPFLFSTEEPIQFNGACIGAEVPTETFNNAVNLIIAAIERGYYTSRDPTPLGPSEWARLSCAILAAVGRGYHRQYSTEKESTLDKIRAEVVDLDPLPKNLTLFHCLAAIVDDISTHVGVDQEGYQDWYHTLKNDFNTKATKAAVAEVDEKWLEWKAKHIDMLAQQYEQEIIAQARNKGIDYFIATGERLGLRITRNPSAMSSTTTPTTGRKRTASGSLPGHGMMTPMVRTITPLENQDASPPSPQSRDTTPCACTRMQTDPPSSQEMVPALALEVKGNTDLAAIMAAINAALGPAIQTAMALYTAKLTALEKMVRPAPEHNTGSGLDASRWAPMGLMQHLEPERNDFITVSHSKRGKKAKGKMTYNTHNLMPTPQSNSRPTSYAGVAAASTGTKQAPAPPRPATHTPMIMEVMVIRAGGFQDKELEQKVRAWAADAIVREVALKMAKTVTQPIPLRARCWSIHPCSKGNFVYSFDGNVPFNVIATYEHILLSPFGGSGKLNPSMGWTRLLAHGVPVWDDNRWEAFGPEALLQEVKAMPGLEKAHFAMPLRWLKPADHISSTYSTITFAISDPDGTITNKLLAGRAAIFRKEVIIQRWVDKPALVQCSHCHALGHIRSSRSCTLGKDLVKCYICGGAHPSDKHDQTCPKKHAVAGICDCKHFKCLNCHKVGHNCRNTLCPA